MSEDTYEYIGQTSLKLSDNAGLAYGGLKKLADGKKAGNALSNLGAVAGGSGASSLEGVSNPNVRENVLKNISDSKVAREGSQYGEFEKNYNK